MAENARIRNRSEIEDKIVKNNFEFLKFAEAN